MLIVRGISNVIRDRRVQPSGVAGQRRIRVPRTGCRGEAMLETVVALPLLVVMLLGLGQQFLVTESQLDHVRITQELMLGPQEPTLVFDPAPVGGAPPFAVLSGNELDGFMTTVEAFISGRIPAKTAVLLQLGYLNLDESSGQVTGRQVVGTPHIVAGAEVPLDSRCRLEGGGLTTYAESQLDTMAAVRFGGSAPAVAPKLYDVTLGSSGSSRAYIPFLPFLFVVVCSEPVFGLYPQNPVSRFMVAPRRLMN